MFKVEKQKHLVYNIIFIYSKMKLCSCNLSSNISIIFILFFIVVTLSVFFEIPTIEYANQQNGEISILQIDNLRK